MADELSTGKLDEFHTADTEYLKKQSRDNLVKYISSLRCKVEQLESLSAIAKQVEKLQSCHVRSRQYNRRESVELHVIPESIEHENLEGTCVGILNEIGCINVRERDIHACHRLKNKKNVIIRFVNRKDADLALHNRAKLKVLDKEGKFDIKCDIYINEILCRPMQFLYWKVRCAL